MSLVWLAEHRWLPDAAIRVGIRRLLRRRLHQVLTADADKQAAATARFADELRRSPITVATAKANQQHYEVPAEFFQTVLGKHLKYSCGYWPRRDMSLDESEAAMLRLTCERAEIEDGMEILDLGCGWGSLTLWLAEHFPGSRILSLSNSHSQRAFIEQACRERGFAHVEVVTSDVARFATERRFDRIVSVEMLEHVRNYERLFREAANWLKPDGKMFVHVFCHRQAAYPFEVDGSADWMARHFFTGGIMPSADLFDQFRSDLSVAVRWLIDGTHYSRTCEAWLQKLDANSDYLRDLFIQDMSRKDAAVQLQRWRMFFMACSELFRYRGGSEWGVAHYRLHHAANDRLRSRRQTATAANKMAHSTTAST